MRILAIETSQTQGSVAAFVGDELRAERIAAQKTARTLAPAMREVLAEAGWEPREVQLVAVSIGPGSFTGLRVGVVTAKAFAYAVGAEIFGVSTLETIAAASPPDTERVCVAIDAHRGQVFSSTLRRDDSGHFVTEQMTAIEDLEPWLAKLAEGALVTGPALEKYAARLPVGVRALAAELWQPQARQVARLAWRSYQAGERHDLWQLVPFYLRKSAAEEKWDQR